MNEQHEERRISIEAFTKVADDVHTIKTALLGNMDSPGWLSRIRTLEGKFKTIQWAMSVLGGGMVAIVINIVSNIFTK